jgi:hypothetical protein
MEQRKKSYKSGLEIQGQNGGYLRSWLKPLIESEVDELEQIMKAFPV